MNNAIFNFAAPVNEPIFKYLKGSPEREALEKELKKQMSEEIEIPLIIGGKEVRTGNLGKVVMPSNHKHVLATYHKAGEKEINMAIEAALEAREKWESMSWVERASIMAKAAELISTKYRYVMNASTMLGQNKNVFQAEIDAVCEVTDFLRYNNHFLSNIIGVQPQSMSDQINRIEYRGLEGFVLTVTPFNFTAIGSNLNASVAVMGNVTVWKPATTSLLSNYYFMKILMEAGIPAGVINFIPGQGSLIGKICVNHPSLAGIHFTGSTDTFNSLWKGVGENIHKYKTYPKLVGETGGKDFIFAHKSANVRALAVSIVAGAYEYQGQKCSAASRAYIPKSLWEDVKKEVLAMLSEIKVGCTTDFNNFVNAVIDEASFDNIMSYIERAKAAPDAEIIAGGKGDKSVGYFVEPTLILTSNPNFLTMEEEIFGPVMTCYLYDDEKFYETLEICNNTSPYGLTGAVHSQDRYAFVEACRILRHAAGNFYLNDKPSGAQVGLQPFGGARKSGTNDKAGSHLNLLRWVSPRLIKETLVFKTQYKYGYME